MDHRQLRLSAGRLDDTRGTLGDRIGRRRVRLSGSAAFALLSVLVAFSRNVEMLIVARALLGVAGAMIAPAARSLIRLLFPGPAENARAISLWLSCLIGGSILGPLVGGLLLAHFWWGAVFLVGVPPMLLALLLGRTLLPDYQNPQASHLHLPSVFTSLAAILPFIYGVKELATHGWQLLPALVLLVRLLFGGLFVWQTGNEFGFALGVAVVGSIGALVYRLHTAALPGGLSGNTVHAVRETLATAVSSAGTLPGTLRQAVRRIARMAFVQEYHAVALLSAAILAALALVIAVKLRALPVVGGGH